MSNFICEECFASKKFDEFHAYDHGLTARWRDTLIDHDKYVRQTQAGMLSPWMKHPGWRLDRNIRDLMHNVFVGGTGNDICASVIKELCDEGCYPGNNLNDRLSLGPPIYLLFVVFSITS